MKSYIIDTHILLWWLENNIKLNEKNKKLISNPENIIIVSVATTWEIIIKKSLNKLKCPNNLLEVLDKNNFNILPIYAEHTLFLEKLPKIHSDPFDRILISQSYIEQIPLITQDKIIKKYF